MSLELVRLAASSELNDQLHLGRLLVLLGAIDRGRGKSVEGITKLAKLDFLLRYPTCLERALARSGKPPRLASVQDYERTTVEAKMVRFKYGPWDARYRRWLSLLVARGLAEVYLEGRTVHAKLTETGRAAAVSIAQTESFAAIASRASVIAKTFGTMSATGLKEFVYEAFPEITSMSWGTEIGI